MKFRLDKIKTYPGKRVRHGPVFCILCRQEVQLGKSGHNVRCIRPECVRIYRTRESAAFRERMRAAGYKQRRMGWLHPDRPEVVYGREKQLQDEA